MVMLFCIKIVQGSLTYEQVPRLLKDKVKEELEVMGLGYLTEEKQH